MANFTTNLYTHLQNCKIGLKYIFFFVPSNLMHNYYIDIHIKYICFRYETFYVDFLFIKSFDINIFCVFIL